MSATSTLILENRMLISVVYAAILYITTGFGSWLLTLLTCHLTLNCDKRRALDAWCPTLALISIRYLTRISIIDHQFMYFIYYIVHYILCIFLSSMFLDIKKRSFHQPLSSINSSKKCKLGISYHLEHKTPKDSIFDKLLTETDPICDEIYIKLLKLLPLTKYKTMDPLDIILAEAENDPNSEFATFINKISKLPEWVDFEKIEKGQNFHISKYITITYILGLGTLVGGFSCPEINKILISSRYWANDNDKKIIIKYIK